MYDNLSAAASYLDDNAENLKSLEDILLKLKERDTALTFEDRLRLDFRLGKILLMNEAARVVIENARREQRKPLWKKILHRK